LNTSTGDAPPGSLAPALGARLKALFDQHDLLTNPADCWTYGYDNSRRQALPEAVCFARNESQIAGLVQACRDHRTPLVTRGRGTGTTGATVPIHGGIVLSTERLRGTLLIDADNRTATVSPGFSNHELQQAAAKQGFFWPPDPTSAAVSTIGGNLAYNSAGPRAVKYGTPRENTLGLQVVTGRGDLLRTGVKTTKGVVGYDLTRLLIGSEGTLAIITEATLKLTPLPESKRTLRALYRGIHDAARAVSRIMAQPATPCALEFMDAASIAMVRQHSDLGLAENTGALLMIEVDGPASCIDDLAGQVAAAANAEGCLGIRQATCQDEIERLWQTRSALSPALRNVAPKKINEDVVVPVSQIPSLIAGIEGLSRRHKLPIVNFGHAGNGNIHVNLLINPEDPQQLAAADDCLDDLFDLTLSLGGSLSGEHGIGLVKRDFIDRELDAAAIALMRGIKQTFDPDGILNPGIGLPQTPARQRQP
jgi:D-lactate dehydrogenase